MTEAITLTAPGIEAVILTYGATLHRLRVRDASGRMGDVLIGSDAPRRSRGFRGATIGRFANRIRDARYPAPDGGADWVTLAANDGPHCLHGGPDGFDRRDWRVTAQSGGETTLDLTSPEGDQGFPGELRATATFALAAPATLTVTYTATTTRPCPVSLTSHGFFNLSGGGPIAGHRLTIPADRYLPSLSAEPAPVSGDFDFRAGRAIPPGIDHCFCPDPGAPTHLDDPARGLRMTLTSDQPGLQVFVPPSGDAVCLEPQAWPDAPNRPDYPGAILWPGQHYRHQIRLSFSTKAAP